MAGRRQPKTPEHAVAVNLSALTIKFGIKPRYRQILLVKFWRPNASFLQLIPPLK
jgi:hypothetical protein